MTFIGSPCYAPVLNIDMNIDTNKNGAGLSGIFVLVRNRYLEFGVPFSNPKLMGTVYWCMFYWLEQDGVINNQKALPGFKRQHRRPNLWGFRVFSIAWASMNGLLNYCKRFLVVKAARSQVAPKHPQPTNAKSLGYWSWWVFMMHMDFCYPLAPGGFRKVDAIWCNTNFLVWGRQAIDCVTHSDANASTMCSNSDLWWPFSLGCFNLPKNSNFEGFITTNYICIL